MKKKLIAAFVILLIIGVAGNMILFKDKKISDAVRFKNEYEQYNNKNSNGKQLLELNISDNNPFVYKTEAEIIKDAKDKKSFVILFGFPSCPWCRSALPSLISAATKTGITEIYYLNVEDIRDTKHLEKGKIVTTKEGTKGYYDLLKQFSNVLEPYADLNDDSVKRILSPTVMFIHNGVADSIHVSTLDTHKDPFVKLSDDEFDELTEIYTKKIQDVLACPLEAC